MEDRDEGEDEGKSTEAIWRQVPGNQQSDQKKQAPAEGLAYNPERGVAYDPFARCHELHLARISQPKHLNKRSDDLAEGMLQNSHPVSSVFLNKPA
jgi:hypothetical protein